MDRLSYRFLIDGKTVAPNATITDFRGKPHRFVGVYHPRKIVASRTTDDKDGTQEYFPSVFSGEIQEQHGPKGTWTRTAS